MSILETFNQELYKRDLRENATAKGFEQGLKCGSQKAHENIVKNCLEKGKTAEEIADFLGEDTELIQKIITTTNQ